MNNAENIARLTDRAEYHNDAQARSLTAGDESKILDAQTILDGAYSELVQSGTVEAGKSPTNGMIVRILLLVEMSHGHVCFLH